MNENGTDIRKKTNAIIIKNLQNLLDAKEVTIPEFAKSLNKSKQAVYHWVHDGYVPSLPVLVQIAKYFNVSLDWLVGINEPETNKIIDLSHAENYQFTYDNQPVSEDLNNAGNAILYEIRRITKEKKNEKAK